MIHDHKFRFRQAIRGGLISAAELAWQPVLDDLAILTG